MRASLLFPPQWTAAQPYYGLATLAGQLARAGVEVRIHDLNLGFMEWALSGAGVRRAIGRLERDRVFVAAEHAAAALREPGTERAAMLEARLLETELFLRERASESGEFADAVESARAALLDPEAFYDPRRLVAALSVVDVALSLASLPFYPAAIRWNDFSTPFVPLNLGPILGFVGDPLQNPFYRFLERQLPAIERDASELYAISIASFSQVLPGLSLAYMLRRRAKDLRTARGRAPLVVLGGNFFSRIRPQLQARPEFFARFADAVVIGEGERAIVEIARAADAGGPPRLDAVSSLLYLDPSGERVLATEDGQAPPLESLAYQDLGAFPLERYLSPERVVCLRASKGCYYGECAFCDCDYGLARDRLEVERLVEEVRHLRERFGVRHIEFVDQCIEPSFLDRMSDAFVSAKLDVRWFCNARTDPGFDRALFDKMRAAGNTMIMWGIESASPRLLKLMKKGVSPSTRLETLRDAHQAGLWNFAYVFFGFPTETEEEARATIDLIRDNTALIHAYGRSVFSLGRHARMMKDPEKFGILDWIEDDQDLSTNLSFSVKSGLSGPELVAMAARCNADCRAAYGDPLWMALRSRENLHLYLARHGPEAVRTWALNPGAREPSFVF